MTYASPEKRREYQRRYRETHPPKAYPRKPFTPEQIARRKEYARTYYKSPEQREKAKLWARAWRAANLDRAKLIQRQTQLRLYGLTIEAFDAMLARQSGGCAICRIPIDHATTNVDHDHVSGSNRGLLCRKCNRGLGLAHDDLDLLEAAARYLRTH